MALPAAPRARTSDWPLPEHGERVLVGPDQVRFLAQDPLSQDCYPLAMGFYPHARGHRMQRQRPADHLLIYCVEGRGWADLPGFQGTVHPGDALLLPAQVPHAYRADAVTPWSLYWVHLGGPLLSQLWPLLDPAGERRIHPGLQERLVREFQHLLNLTRVSQQQDAFRHAASVCRGLLSWMQVLQQRPTRPDRRLDLAAVHQAWQDGLDQPLSLDDLTRLAGQASRYQFIRLYRAHTGQTPMQAFLRMKMARACYLLDTTDQAIAEIASALGVEDPYYFSRMFRRITGQSPTQYRQQRALGL